MCCSTRLRSSKPLVQVRACPFLWLITTTHDLLLPHVGKAAARTSAAAWPHAKWHGTSGPRCCCTCAGKILSLVTALILGACSHLSTYISFFTCDRFGRRKLFLAVRLPSICRVPRRKLTRTLSVTKHVDADEPYDRGTLVDSKA